MPFIQGSFQPIKSPNVFAFTQCGETEWEVEHTWFQFKHFGIVRRNLLACPQMASNSFLTRCKNGRKLRHANHVYVATLVFILLTKEYDINVEPFGAVFNHSLLYINLDRMSIESWVKQIWHYFNPTFEFLIPFKMHVIDREGWLWPFCNVVAFYGTFNIAYAMHLYRLLSLRLNFSSF